MSLIHCIKIFSHSDTKNVAATVDYSFFARDAERYALAAKQRVRRVRDKTPYSEFDQSLLENSLSEGATPPGVGNFYSNAINSA